MGLWQTAVTAAKTGDKHTARNLFLQVSEKRPQNEKVFHWLAYVSDSLPDKAAYLRKVLDINPSNQSAQKALEKVLFRQGVTASRLDNKIVAHQIFLEITQRNPGNQKAWLWLASVAETDDKRLEYLDRLLEIDPKNEQALAWRAKAMGVDGHRPPSWHCPICEHREDIQPIQCGQCGAMLSFDNLDGIIHNRQVDEAVMSRQIDALQSKVAESHAVDDRIHLGMALLNLKRYREGYEALVDACDAAPDNQALQGLVAELQVKLEQLEMERAARESTNRMGRVLVIDDSSTVRKLVSITLERQGYEVITADSGIQALSRTNEITPDLIFLDIKMPNLDGYQICKILKENEATKNIPVVMLSGQDGFFDKVRGRMVGAADYITKPFEAATLLNAIQKYCQG